MLKKEEIHFFNDIAYYHVPFTHCPTGEAVRTQLRCHCNPKDNFDWKGYSCKLSPLLTVIIRGSVIIRGFTDNKLQALLDSLTSTVWTSLRDGRTSQIKKTIGAACFL